MDGFNIVTSSDVISLRTSSRRRAMAFAQRGQVVLLSIILLVGVGVALFASTASTEVTRAVNADARTRVALEQARDALAAYAVGHTFRPGSLPCPDMDDDGIAESFVAGECPSYIGRLPWRTLGIGDLRDEAGERLWYALSPNFRDQPSVQINSDSKGTRTVFSISSSTVLTTQAVAVVFAPGTILPGQVRDSTSTLCAMSGASVSTRRDLCASNYLETSGNDAVPWNNASASGPYMAARPSLAFNDKLLVIRTTDFMPLVERRVANDMLNILLEYRKQSQLTGGCDCYPWPDRDANGSSDADNNRGRLPIGSGRTITHVSQALLGVVTTSGAHNLVSGQSVYLTDIAGMTPLNGTTVTVTVINAAQFSIGLTTLLYPPYTSGGRALPAALPHSWYRSISSITNANPGVVTTTAPHGFTGGQQLYLSGIAGMTQLNGSIVTVTPIDATRFSIDVDTRTYTAYVSGGTTAPRAMRYLEPNNWASMVYYSVARALLQNGGLTCLNCILLGPQTLSVNGTSGYGVVLITPGPVAPSQTRATWAHYIDDAENRDANPQGAGGGAAADPGANDSYVRPPAGCPAGQCPTALSGVKRCVASSAACPVDVTAPTRDHLYSITAPPPYVQCGATAAMLLANAPCHTTGTSVKAVCQEAVTNLIAGLCVCTAAATAMVTPPCRNTLNPKACQTAVALLKACLPL
jgi:hypothetical protein